MELATPETHDGESGRAPLRLKRLVIGGREPNEIAATFQSLFGLTEIAMNGGRRTMLAVGRGALLVVPADEVGGTEGMVALSLVADDLMRAQTAARHCDLMLAVGTTLAVFPIAGVVPVAKEAGARVVIVNAEPTAMDDLADAVLRGPISDILPRLVKA